MKDRYEIDEDNREAFARAERRAEIAEKLADEARDSAFDAMYTDEEWNRIKAQGEVFRQFLDKLAGGK